MAIRHSRRVRIEQSEVESAHGACDSSSSRRADGPAESSLTGLAGRHLTGMRAKTRAVPACRWPAAIAGATPRFVRSFSCQGNSVATFASVRRCAKRAVRGGDAGQESAEWHAGSSIQARQRGSAGDE